MWNQICSIFNNFKNNFSKIFHEKWQKMVKNLLCLKIPQMCYLRHAEHYAKNCTSLRGLDHDTLFFINPLSQRNFLRILYQMKIELFLDHCALFLILFLLGTRLNGCYGNVEVVPLLVLRDEGSNLK